MSSDLRFALNGIREGYTALSREYEPSVEYVLYNSLMQDEIISSLKKLAGKRNNKQDMKAIEAIKKNLIIERFRAKMDTQTKLDEGSFIGQLKLILVKRQII